MSAPDFRPAHFRDLTPRPILAAREGALAIVAAREACRDATEAFLADALDVADWLDDQAERWDVNYAATQAPSRGVDEPPAINYGNPKAAALNADHHARHALAVARAYLGED